MKKIVDHVIQYADGSGRRLSDPFMQLPPRRDLPDYYDMIKRPVDIKKIRDRIKQHRYRSLDDLEKEFMTLCKNTQAYNMEGSLIYEDSIKIGTIFTYARETLEKTGQLPQLARADEATGEDDDADEILAQNEESKTSVEENESVEPKEEPLKMKIRLSKDGSETPTSSKLKVKPQKRSKVISDDDDYSDQVQSSDEN